MGTKSNGPPFVSIFILSATALAYEVFLVRVFSIIHWHHFAFMVISLALLGYGISGSLITLMREYCYRNFTVVFVVNGLLFSISMMGCYIALQHLPFNTLEILWDSSEWVKLLLSYLLLSLPFLFVANTIALSMVRYQQQISRVYGVDLLGAGIGTVAVVLLLSALEIHTVLRILVICGLIAALMPVLKMARFRGIVTTVILSFMVMVQLLPSAWLDLRMSEYKGLEQTLLMRGARLLGSDSSPVSRIDVVESSEIPFRNAPGLSLLSPAGPPPQLAVFRDGDTMTTIDRYVEFVPPAYTDFMTSALPYHLGHQFSQILLLDAATGSELLPAINNTAAHIDAVESDRQLTELFTGKQSDYFGWEHIRKRVSIHHSTARVFAARADQQYDLIVLGVPGGSTGGSAGVYAFATDYTLTIESLKAYIKLLRPDGLLAITLWTDTPPKGNLRLFATVVDALNESAIDDPGKRLAWIRGWNTATLLLKNGVLTIDEIEHVRRFAKSRSFDLAWLPGMKKEESNRYQLLPKPFFYTAAQAMITRSGDAYFKDYQYDVTPVSDSHPYFNDHFRWDSLSDFLGLPGRGGIALIGVGYPTLLLTLLQAIGAAIVLILLPLLFINTRNEVRKAGRSLIVVYFLSIGIAFLFIELSFIEMFTLILGQPVYAVAVALSAFLIFSGLGSLSVQHLLDRNNVTIDTILRRSVTGIVVITLLYLFLRPWIINNIMTLPELARIVSAFLLTAPLAFVMGMPFPIGLTATGQSAPGLLPWAWGINGCASVLSAILAVMLAMEIGFNGVMLSAAALYLVAWKSLPAH